MAASSVDAAEIVLFQIESIEAAWRSGTRYPRLENVAPTQLVPLTFMSSPPFPGRKGSFGTVMISKIRGSYLKALEFMTPTSYCIISHISINNTNSIIY